VIGHAALFDRKRDQEAAVFRDIEARGGVHVEKRLGMPNSGRAFTSTAIILPSALSETMWTAPNGVMPVAMSKLSELI